MSGSRYLTALARTLRETPRRANWKPRLIMAIVSDSHRGEGVHWTLRVLHVGARNGTAVRVTDANASASASDTQVRSELPGELEVTEDGATRPKDSIATAQGPSEHLFY